MNWLTPVLALATALLGCADVSLGTPEERGELLFESPELSVAPLNRFACSTCHDARVSASPPQRLKPGASVAGAERRATFWGGQERDLLRSINYCLSYFMRSEAELERSAADAEALYVFLASLEGGDPEPQPFTVAPAIRDLPRGERDAGERLFRAACQGCHGTVGEGRGKLTELAPVLPDDTVALHEGLTPRFLRLVFTEKVRYGPFFGAGGNMPPFSLEKLSDEELASILEFLGVVDE